MEDKNNYKKNSATGSYESSFEHEGGFYGNPEESDENTDVIKAILGSLLIILNIPFIIYVGMLILFSIANIFIPLMRAGNGFGNIISVWTEYGWLLFVIFINIYSLVKGYFEDKKYFLAGYIFTLISYYIFMVFIHTKA